ncbi:isoprenylcysteine carboxylmethyltransferase family protein [Conexibacter sp. SYSU D00693]|uniref:methyltransferase family protein n=1 Tax=Conexibacter sp. SYSU D00693 TaxID=2812560 RepID=UPI00196B1F33|nr:isoprenylcysteine carboxylmethyltransferase family protein [Conexibacter sp. SYSU D00693]
MDRTRAAALGSAAFFLAGPALELGVGPFLLTGGFAAGDGTLEDPAAKVAGVATVVAALAVVVACFVRFVRDGLGTPSPAAPTQALVVAGPYRWVRNPMYVATVAGLIGEGLLLARPVLLAAAAVYLATMTTLVRLREEPRLRARFGPAYDAYRAQVPGWLPRPPRAPQPSRPRGRA